jgi:type IV pilus assembly protein PilB
MTNYSSARRALVVQTNYSPFGNKLIQGGYISPELMNQAQAESRKSGRPLPEVIASLTGQQLPPDLIRQYKKQQLFELKLLYGVEAFDPELEEISAAKLGALLNLIPLDSCRRYRFIPVERESDGTPPVAIVAMVEPENLEAQDELKRILRSSGTTVRRRVIALEDYQQLISLCLQEQERKEAVVAAQQQAAKEQDAFARFGDNDGELEEAPDTEMDLSSEGDAESQPIVDMVNKILRRALSEYPIFTSNRKKNFSEFGCAKMGCYKNRSLDYPKR